MCDDPGHRASLAGEVRGGRGWVSGHHRARPGTQASIPQATIDAIVHDTLHTVPDDDSTAWSTRTMGERHGVGKDSVARTWQARKLRPWRVDTFKLSNDPRFEEKLDRQIKCATHH